MLAAGGAALLIAIIFVSRGQGPAAASGEAVRRSSSSEKTVRNPEEKIPRSARRAPAPLANLPSLPPPEESPHPPGSSESRQWLAGRTAELDRLSWFDDAESLGKILTELRNTQPEIREAALSATRAFGSRDAIPYLEAFAAESRDPKEQKALADVIEYLQLPTMVEQLEQPPEELPGGEADAP